MKRDQALDHVKQLTMDDRNKTHGDAVQQFEHAQRIKAAVGHHDSPHLTPAEIEAIEMICLKLSRWTTAQRGQTPAEKWADHALDIIGYAAIAVEAIYATAPAPKEENLLDVIARTADLQRIVSQVSPFAGPSQVARPAPSPRTVIGSPPPDGTSAA